MNEFFNAQKYVRHVIRKHGQANTYVSIRAVPTRQESARTVISSRQGGIGKDELSVVSRNQGSPPPMSRYESPPEMQANDSYHVLNMIK